MLARHVAAVPHAEALRKPLDGMGGALTLLGAMRHEDTWDDEAARGHDTPGSGMFAAEVLAPVVDRLAEHAAEEIQVRRTGRGVQPACRGRGRTPPACGYT